MRSPKANFSLALSTLGHEIRLLLSSRSLLALLLIAAPLVGYGFIQAVSLFSEASRAALEHRELSPGMNPLEGVLVPTFGGLYLITTLLFPFVAIRPIAMEKQSGSLKIVLQLKHAPLFLVVEKALAAFFAWGMAFSVVCVATIWWSGLEGHIHGPELFNLALGHGLYAFVILGLAFLISSLTQSASTAAICVLGVTLGSWVVDFSAQTESQGFLRWLSMISLTSGLRNFERGLFSSADLIRLTSIGGGALIVSSICVQIGRAWKERLLSIGVILVACVSFSALAHAFPFYRDFSEDRRNSLPAEDEALLIKVPGNLSIHIFLTPDDPRYRDLERQLLSKFRRVVPHVQVRLRDTGKTALYGVGGTDNYGLNRYEYEGKVEESRSTSPREILPLVHRITGNIPPTSSNFNYPGYPLVVDSGTVPVIFYFMFPLLFIGLWWWFYRLPRELKLEVVT